MHDGQVRAARARLLSSLDAHTLRDIGYLDGDVGMAKDPFTSRYRDRHLP